MGRKKGHGVDHKPYLTQLHPLTPQQLINIFCNGQELSKTSVSFVESPQNGQVFIMDCVVFGRYDSHRWSNVYCHNGMGPLVVDGANDPWGDDLEVRYNKKLGKNGNLIEGAVRLVYKLKSKPGAQNKPAVDHHAVQYMDKLPDYVEEVISQKQEQMEEKMKEVEKTLKKESTDVADIATTSSSFGRKRKRNSWYLDLYDTEDPSSKSHRTQETQENSMNEGEEYIEEDESYDESLVKVEKKRINQDKGRVSGMRHEGRVWMAGYGLEKTKPKSSLLFRMHDGDDEDDEDGESGHEQEPTWSEGNLNFCENEANSLRSTTEYLQTSEEQTRLLYYSVAIPSPVLTADKMLSSEEITKVIDAVLEGRTYVCTSPVLLPKLGELFVLKAELCVEDGEIKEECGIFHNKKALKYSLYNRPSSSQICSDTSVKTPDVKVVYRTEKHPQFCLIHYLSSILPRNKQWKVDESDNDASLLVNQNTESSCETFTEKQNQVGQNVVEGNVVIFKNNEKGLDIGEKVTIRDNERKMGSGNPEDSYSEKTEGLKMKDNSEKMPKESEKRGKQPGRPRFRRLNDIEEKAEDEEDRRKEFDEDEPRPFMVYKRGKLYYADAEELFSRAKREGLTLYKNVVKKPQYGDIYLLDKHFVPYSDSLAWVREYYYKSSLVLLERFTLRDPTTSFHYPLPPTAKSVFTLNEGDDSDSLPCIVHYQKDPSNISEGTKLECKVKKKETTEVQSGVYTESNSYLNLSLVEAMLTNPDQKRIVSAPILNPQPFQVYLVQLPPDKDSKVLDNYRWTDKGFKRWPPGVPVEQTRLFCHHSPMKVTRGAMCQVLMRHEFRHSLASPHLRVVHYMPTREFREYIVIANAASQMETASEASRDGWENMEEETEPPIHVSCSRLKPGMAWDLLSRETANLSQQVLNTVTAMEIITPQPGGVYLSSKYEAPDLLKWEELGKLQVQPRMYQLVEVCHRVKEEDTLPSYLVRLTYTSPKVPHRVLVHYLGDTRPYLVQECQVVIDSYTGEPCYRTKGRKIKHYAFLEPRNSLKEKKLYHISTALLREAGCCPLQLEDLDLDVEVESKVMLQKQEVDNQLISPDKPGLYLYGYRMVNKRVIRLLESIDKNRKIHLPIKNPEAGEGYLITKPSSSKVAIDPYKWTQKGWQPIPRKEPVILWRWGLMRHRKQTWAPPLIRIDYVHVSVNTDLMFVHYLPTKDNQNMLEIRSAIIPMRTQTHTLLSMGDVNFGQHSQLLTNSPLPPSHIWELLSAGGGLTLPLSQPQPGGVYVINLDEKETLDWLRWRSLGSLRLSSADYCLMETTSLIDWEPSSQLARLTYHSPLVKSRTVIHYLGDSRPYLDKAKAEEAKHQRKLETMRRKASTSETLEIECLEIDDTQLSLPDICTRDAATEAVGSILTGLGSDSVDTDTLNHTFAELGGEVEGLCEDDDSEVRWREEDNHLRDANLPTIQVPYGSICTTSLVKQLFPQGLPKIVMQKVFEVETGDSDDKKQQLDTLLDLPNVKFDSRVEKRMPLDPHRAVAHTMLDWGNDSDDRDDLIEDGIPCENNRAKLQITTTEPRTIVYLKQHDSLTEKQIDHMLSNPDVKRISFLPLIDPQADEVYVVAVPYRKGETRRLDCYNWYVTGHKKGKYRRTYSYIKEEDGNTSHRLMRYTYDYAWEAHPGLRVVHYIQGNPKHQVQCSGKQPNFEEECDNQGDGPMYQAYTAPMTHRDAIFILNDPPQYHVCELPIKNPRAGDVYIVKAPNIPLARRELLYDTLTWEEGQVKHVGGKKPVIRKIKYVSMDPSDDSKSEAFVRVTWERLVDATSGSDLPSRTHKNQPYLIIHYLGDETMAGEMVRKGKDGTLHLRQIRHYMETGSYLPSVHINEKNGIRKSAKKFMIEGKNMYYIGQTGKEKRLVIYTNEEKKKVFDECHILSKTGEHFGRTKTLRRLTEKYYWTCMVEDIVALIVRCKTCEFSKMHRSYQRFVRVTEPWEVVSIDIVGQFVSSERGHVFLATIIDMLTKYTIAVPMRDTTAADIAKALKTAVFQQGPPRKFVSDQHEEFIKELNIALELDSGLVGNVLAVNKTQINRPDEATIKTSLLQHCLESGDVWDDVLQRKVYEINTSYVTASGYTPFYLMFLRHPRPMDVIFDLPVNSNTKPNFVVRDIERFMDDRERKANDILTRALSGDGPAHEGSDAGESESGECIDGVSASTLLDAVAGAGQASIHVVSDIDMNGSVQMVSNLEINGGHAGVHMVSNVPNMEVSGGAHAGVQMVSNMKMEGVDQDHTHYTHVTHLPDAQVVDEGGGSVYEMGDGEGQVVVVADGLPGLDDAAGGGGEVMVVQPSGVGRDQGVIMLAENQVIMETVDGRQFTYIPQT